MTAPSADIPAPSGQAHHLATDLDDLHVVEVGGTLRSWARNGREVLAGFAADAPIDAGRGQQLLPWPNRLRDGRYTFDGVERQLPITEVAHHNASHGLLRWAPWSLTDRGPAHLTMGVTLHPQPGWAWTLHCTTTYAVAPDGLSVTSRVTNLSDSTAPFGAGWHPYVRTESSPVEDVEIAIPATQFVTVDDRLLPTGLVDVREATGAAYDFRPLRPTGATVEATLLSDASRGGGSTGRSRGGGSRGGASSGRRVGERRLDTAYTGIEADPDGKWRVHVDLPDGTRHTVWGEAAAFPWLQVFTGKAEASHAPPHGIAVEPMTCPPDAFNSGESLIRLEPGQSWTGTWGISAPA